MAHRAGRKEEGRARILASAGRGFRSSGFSGLGVDRIARNAGVTSGAFYAHFSSKSAAFEAALIEGIKGLREGVERFQRERGSDWLDAFINFYVGDQRICDLANSCALQSLTGEVARAGPEVRTAYERELETVIAAVASGLEGVDQDSRSERAMALLALLSGGVTMARAVAGREASDGIATAVRVAAHQLLR